MMHNKAPDAITGFYLLARTQNYERNTDFPASRD